MEINSLIQNIKLKFPLFENLINNTPFVFSNDLIPAPAYTDGTSIFYNTLFGIYTPRDQEFILSHELLHIVLRHLNRNQDKDRDLLNYCEDAIINQMLKRVGLDIPKGAVNVEDALSYSVEELYFKNIDKLDEIKKYMQENTYHIDSSESDMQQGTREDSNSSQNTNEEQNSNNSSHEDNLNSKNDQKPNENDSESNSSSSVTGQDILDANNKLLKDILENFKETLKEAGSMARNSSIKLQLTNQEELLSWKDILNMTLYSSSTTRFGIYETEKDGIIRRDTSNEVDYAESEIIVDSSASMSQEDLKVILQECKNILASSSIRLGFCDTKFYGWQLIDSDADLDDIIVKGRGGTDLKVMAKSFTDDAENKIIITDGGGIFPEEESDILWIILSNYIFMEIPSHINYIHIKPSEIEKNSKNKVIKNH